VLQSASCRQLIKATKKRIRKSSKSRLLKSISPTQEIQRSADFLNTDSVMTDTIRRDSNKEDIKFSTMIIPELDANQPEVLSQTLSSVYTEDQPMDEVVLDIERRIIHMPCRNSVSPMNKLDNEELLQNQSESSPVIVPSQISEHFSRQIISQNSPLLKPIR